MPRPDPHRPPKKQKQTTPEAKTDPLAIPAMIRKRYFRRERCERVGPAATQHLNAVLVRQTDRIVALAMRLALVDGVSTIKPRHAARAIEILGITIY